jgi:decaprenyl-phosphate phosphoribosyltransferase
MDSTFSGLLKLMRPRQWVKNVFVLAPLLFSGLFTNADAISRALLALVMFCLAASATYIINDIHDRENDRCHPVKCKQRPLASGQVQTAQALGLLALIVLGLLAGAMADRDLALVVAGYMALSTCYTFWLKNLPVLDIFSIAAGFVLRVFGGAVAIDVQMSSWMFATTMCMALYLAAIKRRQELLSWGSEARDVLNHYSVQLIDRYAALSSTGALLFYSLYVMTEHPDMVITMPLVLYGLFRYWYLVETHNEGESPTDALLSDLPMMLTSLALVACCAWALWPQGS